MFAIWYAYDEAGRPTWVVMPDANYNLFREEAGFVDVYEGDLYVARGPSFGQPFDPAKVVLTKAGFARLKLKSRSAIELDWTLFGRSETRPLERLAF